MASGSQHRSLELPKCANLKQSQQTAARVNRSDKNTKTEASERASFTTTRSAPQISAQAVSRSSAWTLRVMQMGYSVHGGTHEKWIPTALFVTPCAQRLDLFLREAGDTKEREQDAMQAELAARGVVPFAE